MVRSSGPRTASTMQNSDAPSGLVSPAARSTSSVSRNGVAFTGVSKRDDWEQKWQSSGQPPVLADRMPSTSTSGPHQASRTWWASAARDVTALVGQGGQAGELVAGEQPSLVEQGVPAAARSRPRRRPNRPRSARARPAGGPGWAPRG